MKEVSKLKFCLFSIASFCTIVSYSNCATAEIIPDKTLPNNSKVKVEGNKSTIEGGTTTVTNLFHSFEKFGVPTGGEAHFNNAIDIQNIITRVTGKSISDIDGLIKANGAANLFLINPNGIIFGENARLDIGGSFVGSTANAIGFGEDNFFSATDPENSSSLLKVKPDALFFNQINSQATIQSNLAADAGLNTSGAFNVRGFLRVPNGESLLLVGGDINIDGGGLYALGGRVELGGLAGEGTVGLNGDGNNLSLIFPEAVERSDVSLSNGATVAVIAEDGGSIAINARDFEMSGESWLLAGIQSGLGSEQSRAGNINVNVTEEINLNNGSLINNRVLPRASGQGGDVNLGANTLLIEAGGQVSTSTFGSGSGGNLTVEAQDIQIIGDQVVNTGLFASAVPDSTGNARDLTINTNTLQVEDGAQVSTGTFGEGKAGDLRINTNTLRVEDGAQVSTVTFGKGEGGKLTVKAKDVLLIGTSKVDRVSSGLFTSAQADSIGNAGDLTIKTNTLQVQDEAWTSTSTYGSGSGGDLTVYAGDVQLIGRSEDDKFNSGLFASTQPDSTGDAGDLTINTNTLRVQDGAQASTSTYGSGSGGDLTVYAGDVQLIGTSKGGQSPSGLFASSQRKLSGDAGDLTINTNILQVENGAGVSVVGFTKQGIAGELTINANSIRLNNNAILTASTTSNKIDPEREQTTININSQNLIMRHSSNIFTNAEGENVIGGNINIDTDFLIANENSDISANSANFRGGNVRIDAQGIFGTDFRNQPSPATSDITATGNNNLNGTVEINTPQTDPNNGLVKLPTIPVEAEVANACSTSGYAQSSFTITGKGSLPPSPLKPLTGSVNRTSLATLDGVEEVNPQTRRSRQAPKEKQEIKQIVDARGWVRTPDGKIILVAHATQNTNFQGIKKFARCKSMKN